MTHLSPAGAERLKFKWPRLGIHKGCGGIVTVQDWRKRGDFRYEAYYEKCSTCDPNGWSTQRETIEQASKYFGIRQFVASKGGGK